MTRWIFDEAAGMQSLQNIGDGPRRSGHCGRSATELHDENDYARMATVPLSLVPRTKIVEKSLAYTSKIGVSK